MIIKDNNNNTITIKNSKESISRKNILNESNIKIFGENNNIFLSLNNNQTIEELINKAGFTIYINGNNNLIDIGSFDNVYVPETGAIGLNITIGGYKEDEECNNSILKIGNNNMFYGVYIHLKDNDSSVTIGNDCLISWCNYIWCTDGHTLTDLEGNPINHAKSIEIGDHVWIGKDVKICKNTKIADNSVIGWGSIVTKKFKKQNVVIAGNPAKIVKENINWDSRCISQYEKELNQKKN